MGEQETERKTESNLDILISGVQLSPSAYCNYMLRTMNFSDSINMSEDFDNY